MEISEEEKVKIASEFLLNAPPGEFNDVFNDIRVLIGNDGLLQRGVSGAFQEYNTEQFTPVDMPGQNYKVIISKHGQISATEYIDPRSNQKFAFDHMRQLAENPEPYGAAANELRDAVDKAFQDYIGNHYPTAVVTVYGDGNTITVCLVSNKYSPNNYWNGRWRSLWTINGNSVKGVLRAQVHYYEDGNVQLNTEKTVEFTASGDIAKSVVDQAKKAEQEYQIALNESYGQLSDTTFKALRRALPITRNKLDWNKILSYKIGSELSNK